MIVPLETSYFAIHGVHKLLETIALLADRIGHDPAVRILPTLYDGRTRFARETLAEIRELFKELCFDTVIRSNVKLREAARRGLPINRFARSANGAIDYAALAMEVEADAAPPARATGQAGPRAGATIARSSSASETAVRRTFGSRETSTAGFRTRRTVPGPNRGDPASLDEDPDPPARDLRVSIRGRW